ncbi:hypothetical protein HK098_007894 [Nowakowskiella sp. JEL0407]|nr:hypothetical protein HK098_007894 [Nowakowskiella sp. JEL0407]
MRGTHPPVKKLQIPKYESHIVTTSSASDFKRTQRILNLVETYSDDDISDTHSYDSKNEINDSDDDPASDEVSLQKILITWNLRRLQDSDSNSANEPFFRRGLQHIEDFDSLDNEEDS